MLQTDYQWPSAVLPRPARYVETSAAERASLQHTLERWFSHRLGHDCLLLPSGRAALSLALATLGAGRGHTVFAPKWSSHCVWSILGRHANPTTTLTAEVDVMLAVYKFGRRERVADAPMPRLVIEDSCDTLVLRPSALFALGGACELFSLPKIMGSYGGGLLVFADAALAQRARALADESAALSRLQGRARWALTPEQALAYNAWDVNEYQNFVPDLCLLDHLQQHLPALDRNAATIQARLQALRSCRPHWFTADDQPWLADRLPPVLCIPPAEAPVPLMTRHINTSGWHDRPAFAKQALVPLHFGVDDRSFDTVLDALKPA